MQHFHDEVLMIPLHLQVIPWASRSNVERDPPRRQLAAGDLDHREVTVPLCVDLDGTLVRSNVLVETLVGALKQRPLLVFALPVWLARGRAALKRELAARAASTSRGFPTTRSSSPTCAASGSPGARSTSPPPPTRRSRGASPTTWDSSTAWWRATAAIT
jgi:hypothetical protein